MKLPRRRNTAVKSSEEVPKMMWVRLLRIATAGLIICAVVQMGIESTVENIACAVLSLITPYVVCWIVFRRGKWNQHPIPVIAVLLFVVSNMLIPLVTKTFELQPLTFNLALPMLTFGLSTVTALVLAVAYVLYESSRFLAGARNLLSKRIFEPMCLFRAPSDAQLWMMGILGSLATVYVLLTGTFYEKVHSGDQTLVRLIWGFTPFSYAPFLIVARHLFSNEERSLRLKPSIVIQFVVVVALGMGLNGRSTMIMPLVNIAVWLLLGAMTRITIVTKRAVLNTLIVGAFIIFGASFTADLATAMVIARTTRQKTDALQLISNTIDNLSKNAELDNERAKAETRKGNNIYVHNEFLSRFTDIKFLDLSLDWQKDITPLQSRQFEELVIEKAWEILPTPVAAAIGVKVNKDLVQNQKSFGDFFFDAKYNEPDLVSKQTSNAIAVGLVLHGVFFFPILVVACLVLFTTYDAMLVRYKTRLPVKQGGINFLCFAPVSLFNIYLICGVFLSLNGHDSEIFYLTWIFRDLPQMVILYFLMFRVTQSLEGIAVIGHVRQGVHPSRR